MSLRGNEIPTNHPSELYTIYNPAARTDNTQSAIKRGAGEESGGGHQERK